MPFINGLWVEPSKNKEKKKISPAQINMYYLLSSDIGRTYRVGYTLMITDTKVFDPRPLQNRDVDQVQLRKSIMAKLPAGDRPYMKLTSFSISRAYFEFDWLKWMKDSLSNVNPNNRISKFEQRFKFSKQLPLSIVNSTARVGFDEFLVRKFKEYMSKNRKDRAWFQNFLPRELGNAIRTRLGSMFEYRYDWQTNSLIAKLKDIYIIGILFAIGNEIDKRKNRKQELVKIDFEKVVKRKARRFDKNKWESFIKKRFI